MKKILFSLTLVVSAAFAGTTPVDLNGWAGESYPAVSGFPAGDWQVAADNLSVTQVNNGQPTIFYSDIAAFGTDLAGTISSGGGDDDYIGFVLGFEPGDSANASADYLLVDWKRGTQTFNFGTPSNITPGSTAFRGLAVSRVTGLPTADEFWGHVNFQENPAGGLAELARANTLFDTAWAPGQNYDFVFEFSPNRLKIFVDGVLEFDVTGSFSNGRWGFYNFSQANVTYSSFTTAPADSDGDGFLDPADNCQFVSNPNQDDSDGDDIGNVCDADIAITNDCFVNFVDLTTMSIAFFSMPASPNWNPDADLVGGPTGEPDGAVNFPDLTRMAQMFFAAPGPSGLPGACAGP